MARTLNLHSAADLAAAVADARPDAAASGIVITSDWCRDQMHALGETRYEDVDEALLHAICERADDLPADTMTAVTVDDQPIDGWLRLNPRQALFFENGAVVRLSDITTEEDDDQTEAWNQIAAIFGFDWSPGQWDSAEGESETVQSVTARKDVR